ncbi:MAG: alkyl hydroperoxide reductase [Rhizobiales bacterium 65-9]|nr:MAG: alkyl hydroperoxide reductase [Rhizobiales bacterium 65-9]
MALISLALASHRKPAYATSGGAVALRDPAPPLFLQTLDGAPRGLEAFRGKAVIVHFFATWCEPCREEMAGLSRLAERIRRRPVVLLAVDVGEAPLRVRRFFERQPIPFSILLDENRDAMKAWKVAALPSSFILDPSHALRVFAAGPVDWDDAAALQVIDSVIDPNAQPLGMSLPPLQQRKECSDDPTP